VPVLSVFAGLRPLAAPEKRGKKTPKDFQNVNGVQKLD
jgi:hypothetical protein